ncbi:hypothetical protein [Fodinicurvata halophila]|uniref:hypothetical protein n=1 Tax=Fodinicurvata halophila TaxID=1419723 RepID=UPI003631C7F3
MDRLNDALEENQLMLGWSKAAGLIDQSLEWTEFREIVRRIYDPDAQNMRWAGNAAGHLWRFIREMGEGDLVVVPYGSEFYVAKVTGDAEHRKDKVEEDMAFRRPVEWLNDKKPIPRKHAKAALLSRMKAQGSCTGATDLVEQVEECLRIAKEGVSPPLKKISGKS